MLTVLACVGCGDSTWVAATEDGEVRVSKAFVGESANGESAALYFALGNQGPDTDALVDVEVDGVGWAEVHRTSDQGGMRVMSPVASLDLPSGSVVALAPGGTHVMLRNLTRLPAAGDSVYGRLRLRSGRMVPLTAAVVALTDLERVLDLLDISSQ